MYAKHSNIYKILILEVNYVYYIYLINLDFGQSQSQPEKAMMSKSRTKYTKGL